jgi:hypothetical protein
MREPFPHNPDYFVGSIPLPPSREALAWVMKEAQFWANRRGIIATLQTYLADLDSDLAKTDGYGMLLVGLDFDIFAEPAQFPQTLADVALLYDLFKAKRDERRAHERRLADGTPPAPRRMANGTPAPDLRAQLHALEASRPLPAPMYAAQHATPAPAKKASRWHRIKPWHIFALMIGGAGMLLSRGINDDSTFAYVFPIISATLVAWFVSRIAPIWVPALIVGGFGFWAALNVKDVKERRRDEWKASMAAYALRDVCDGKPSNQAPKGNAKVRELARAAGTNYWNDAGGSWPRNLVPKYTLCTSYSYEDVQCGEFTEIGRRNSSPTRLCTSRANATVELRNTQTAAIVVTKTFRGSNPPPLSYNVQLGGRGSTDLTGDRPSYEKEIFPAIEPYLK